MRLSALIALACLSVHAISVTPAFPKPAAAKVLPAGVYVSRCLPGVVCTATIKKVSRGLYSLDWVVQDEVGHTTHCHVSETMKVTSGVLPSGSVPDALVGAPTATSDGSVVAAMPGGRAWMSVAGDRCNGLVMPTGHAAIEGSYNRKRLGF